MKNKISIRDVARLAGVSPTTVSRVINDSEHPVNIKTKNAVEDAVKELNFQPNRLAQGLIKNKSNIIGVIVHDISDEYFAEMVKGIESIIFNHDYIVNIYNTNRDIHKELKAINMLKANRAEAIVLTGGYLLDDYYMQEMKQYIEQLKKQGCYIISVTSHPFDIKNIEIGNKLAARTITEYLLNKGHRDIAYVNGPEILNTTKDRFSGYKQALRDRNINLKEQLIIPGDFSFEGGRRAVLQLFKYIEDITAIVAANDETALGLMWQLKQKGIKIPEDISIVGIGNIPAARYSYPPLTTISLPLYTLGKQIGNYIMSKLQKDSVIGEDIEVHIGLVERKSVRDLG
jgi:LacI family transcriptional regulator